MNFAHIVRVLLGHWKSILVSGLGLFLVAVIIGRLTPPNFEATTQVIFNVRAPETLGTSTQSAVEQLEPDYLSTQIDVIRSDRIARVAVQRLQLTSNPATATRMGWDGTGSIENFLAPRIAEPLRVRAASPTSRVIEISYSSSNPRFASEAANAFADAYIDTALDLQAQPARDSSSWYQRRARDLQRELIEAQTRLSIREKELGVASDPNQASSDDVALQALSAQLAGAKVQDAQTAARGANSLPDAMANPVVQTLQSEIAKLEAQREQLGKTAGPNNPDYVQIKAQIDALRGQMAKQIAQVQASTRATAALSANSISKVNADLAAQKQAVIVSRSHRDELAVLQQDVRNLQMVYDQMAARRSQLDLLGESTSSNVAILSRSTPPERPSSSKKKVLAALGLFGGLFAASAFWLLKELIDQRLRTDADFEDWLGIPSLGTVGILPAQPRQLSARVVHLLPFLVRGEDA